MDVPVTRTSVEDFANAIAESFLVLLLLRDVFDTKADDRTVFHEPSFRDVRIAQNAENGERSNELLGEKERANVGICWTSAVPIL